jgi:CRP/FNR family transcriptional regulator
MIFEIGEQPGLIGILKSGYLRKEHMSAEGERTLVDLVFPGDIVGTFPGRNVNYSLEAATESEVCMLDATTSRRMLNESAAFRRGVVADMNRQLDRQLTLVWLRGAMTGRERVLAFFVMAAQTMPTEASKDGSLIVTIPISRKDWADLCSTTVESISRRVSELTEAGLLESLGSNRYRLPDPDKLRQEAGLERGAFRHVCAATNWNLGVRANDDREPVPMARLIKQAANGLRELPVCGRAPV